MLALLALVVGRPRGAAARSIGVFCLGVALWNAGVWGLFRAADLTTARPLAYLTWAALFTLPSSFLHLAALTTDWPGWRRLIVANYAVSAICISLLATRWGVSDLQHRFGAWFATPTPLVLFYIGGFMPANVGLSGWLLWRKFRSPDPLQRSRARTLFVIVMAMPLAALKESLHLVGILPPPTTNLGAMPWSSLAASGYGILAAYTVLNDRLGRVRLFIGRRLAVALRLSFFALVMLLILLVSETAMIPASSAVQKLLAIGAGLIAAILCALPFPRDLDSALDRWRGRLLGESLIYRNKLRDFIDRVPFIDEPTSLVEETCDTLVRAYGVTACAIWLTDQTGQRWQEGRIGDTAWSPTEALPAWAAQQLGLRLPGLPVQPAAPPANAPVRDAFVRVFPLGEKEGAARGFLALGKRESWPWTQTDSAQVRELCRHLTFQFDRMAIAHTEQLRQINAAKDRFLSSINHEMRNPLNGVKGIASMLRSEAGSPRAEALLRNLHACIDRLSATIEEVMDFANLDAGAIQLEEQTFELGAFLHDTVGLYNLQRDQVAIETMTPTPLWLIGDTGKLRQILGNYLDNALKYGTDQTATLRVSRQPAAADEISLQFEVVNAGTTLTDANIEALFEPFERGQRAQETQAPGLGIGLSLCRRVGNAMGGRTTARNDQGQTIFSFSCTFTPSSPAAPAQRRLRTEPPVHVLAIEDEDYNRLALGHYLQQLGVRVSWARDGESALTELNHTPRFDAVLMDWHLPGLSGAALLDALRQRQTEPAAPVIVISAFSTVAKREECLRAGAQAFLSKPLQPQALHDALVRSLAAPPSTTEPSTTATPATWVMTAEQRRDLHADALRDVREILARWDDVPERATFLAHAARGKLALLGEQVWVEQLGLVEQHLLSSPTDLAPVRELLITLLQEADTAGS